MIVLGLNGAKHSGKDTAGAYLVERHGFVRLSFADMLKRSAAAALGIEYDEAAWDSWKNNDEAKVLLTIDGIVEVEITFRQFLQFYGTEAHRELFGTDFWVDAARPALAAAAEAGQNVVFTDARFENELKMLVGRGGAIVRITGRGATGDTHASENPPPDELIDVTLDNSGTKDELYSTLDVLVDAVAGAATA